MLPSVDPFLAARHLGDAYNCLHFARDVWLALTGDDIETRLRALRETFGERRARHTDMAQFERLDAVTDPCLVVFRRATAIGEMHIGVFLRGKVLHLTESGAHHERLDLALQGFNPKAVRYYR